MPDVQFVLRQPLPSGIGSRVLVASPHAACKSLHLLASHCRSKLLAQGRACPLDASISAVAGLGTHSTERLVDALSNVTQTAVEQRLRGTLQLWTAAL